MRVYGNLINRFSEHSTSPTPEIGMGATIYLWSDRYAATVTKVNKTGRTVELTEDRVTGWKDFYGTTFEPDPNGRVFTARLNRNGLWRVLRSGEGVTLGSRAAYRDPSF